MLGFPQPGGHSLLDLDEKNTSRIFKFASVNFGCQHVLLDWSFPLAQRDDLTTLGFEYFLFFNGLAWYYLGFLQPRWAQLVRLCFMKGR